MEKTRAKNFSLEEFIKEDIFRKVYKNVRISRKIRTNFYYVFQKKRISKQRREWISFYKEDLLEGFYDVKRYAELASSNNEKDFFSLIETDLFFAGCEDHFNFTKKDWIEFQSTSLVSEKALAKTTVARRLQEQFDELVLIAQVFKLKDFAELDPDKIPEGFAFDYTDLNRFHTSIQDLPE